MKTFAIIVSLFAVAFCSEVEKANRFVDQTIETRSDELKNIEIPAYAVTIPIPGGKTGAKFYGGNLTGLENVQRTRDSVVRDTADDYREISYYVGTKNVTVFAKASYVIWKPFYVVHFNGKVDEIELEIKIFSSPETKLRVVKGVKLTKFDGFELKINAPGIVVDTFVNTALRATRIAYEPIVKYVIERHIKDIVTEEVEARNKVVG